MANLLIDKTLTSAFTVPAAWGDVTDMSEVVTIVGTDSMVILMMSLNPEMVETDACAEYRFTHDGAQVGPALSCTMDQIDEGSGITLFFALSGLAAGSHTFAVQAQRRENTAVIDTAFQRTFQCVEIESGATFLVNKSSVAADTSPATYADIVDLSDTQTPADGSLLLFILGMTQLFDSDVTAKYQFAIDGTREGPEGSQFSDSSVEGNSLSMAYGRTGVSAVSHTFSVQWERTQATPIADTARTRHLQIIEFTADADLLVDKESISDQDAPAAFADVTDMEGSANIDGVDSIALVLCNMTQRAGSDQTSNRQIAIAGVREGAEISSFSDIAATDDMSGLLVARAVTGESGATTMSMQWFRRRSIPRTHLSFPRTFQVIDLVKPSVGNMAGTIPLTLTPAATVQANGQLAGSSNLVISPAGTLTALGQLIGSSALILTPAGTLGAQGELAGAINLIITPAGTIAAAGALAGSVDLVLTPTATIQALGALLGSSALVLTAAGTIQAQGALAGAVALLLTPAATLQARGELIGTAALILTVDGDLKAVGGNLAGVIPLVLTATGTLAGLGALAGAANLILTPSGTLQATGGLIGDASLTLTLAGDLQALGELLGSSDLVLTPAGNLAGQAALSGSADLVLAAAGTLGGIGGLAGTIPLTLDAAGALIAQSAIAGSLTMTLTPTGTIRADASIAGSVDLALTVTGALVQIGGLSGTIDMTIDPAGNLVGRGELAGSSDLAIAAAGDLGAQGNLTGSAQLTITADGTLRAVGELQGLAELALTLAGILFDQSAKRIPNSLQSLLVFLQNSRQDLSAGELNSDQSIIAGRLNSDQ